MTRGHGGRIAVVEDVFEPDETAQIAQQEEFRLAPWLENRFEMLKKKLEHQIGSLTVASQLRNQPSNPPSNPQIVEEENYDDFNLDPRRWESRLPSYYDSFVDWSLPPIYDDYPKDFYYIAASMEGNNIEDLLIDFGPEKLEVVGFNSSPKFEESFDEDFISKINEVLGDQEEEVEHYDFIGVEQFFSTYSAQLILILYLKNMFMKSRLLNLAWKMDMRKFDDSKYSKYLIIWGGRFQYLSVEDHLNSRPNSLQQGENDGARKKGFNNLVRCTQLVSSSSLINWFMNYHKVMAF